MGVADDTAKLCSPAKSKDRTADAAKKKAELEKRLQVRALAVVTAPRVCGVREYLPSCQDVSGKLSGGKPPKPRGENGGKGLSVAASQRQSRLSASSSSSEDSDDDSSSGSGSSTSSDSESDKGR